MRIYIFIYLGLVYAHTSLAFEVAAHRGMYVPLKADYKPEPKDCVAEKIADPAVRPPEIRYTLENTVQAISKAFELGADRSSINLQLSQDGKVVLFHDQDLGCKTDHKGSVRDYTLKQLQEFNMGAGYRFGGTYPWRDPKVISQGYTRISTLEELMQENDDRAYWIVIRPGDATELAIILRQLKPHQQMVTKSLLFVMVGRQDAAWVKETVARELPEITLPRFDKAKDEDCRIGFKAGARLPQSCNNLEITLQVDQALTMGFDLKEFGEKLHQVGSRLVIGTDMGGFVETVQQASKLVPYRSVIDGIMTNRIDEIGPFFKE